MALYIEAEHLISLVKAKPVIWNKSSASYKDKSVTKEAWRQIFRKLDSNYDSRSEEERTEFGREVVKKWWNIRDTYVRSCRKIRTCKVTGQGHKIKKYVFADQLQFLSSKKQETEEQDETEPDYTTEYLQTNSDNEEGLDTIIDNEEESHSNSAPLKKRRNEHEYSPRRVLNVTSNQKRHLCFFKGIVPSLHDFDEDETIEFQMGVLKLISAIKRRHHANSDGNCVEINWLTTEGGICKGPKREPFVTSDTEVDPF